MMKAGKYKKKGINRVLNVFCVVVLVICGAFISIAASLYIYISMAIDFETDYMLYEAASHETTTRLYVNDVSGADIGINDYLALESTTLYGTKNSIWCDYDNIPQYMKDAFVAIEDRRFFEHDGVDWKRTAKAAANYIMHFDSRFGGSTITQQLVKNVTGDRKADAFRKLREVVRAIDLENKYSKTEILELYMNVVPMSHNCIGVGAAAKSYFKKSVDELTLAQCASLVAIINSPTKYDPVNSPENNVARRNLVLSQMLEYGYITESEYNTAIEEPLEVSYTPEEEYAKINSWYTDTVIGDLIDDISQKYNISRDAASNMVYSGGLRVYTCMDSGIQKKLENYFYNLNNKNLTNKYDPAFSAVVIDPTDGDLLGIIGDKGEKTANRTLNLAVDSKRPPGSALKPISIYAPAIEDGIISYASVFDDVPLKFQKRSNGSYKKWPKNADGVYSGLTDVADAVAYSKNTVAVKIYELLGSERIYSYLYSKLGLDSIVRSKYTDTGKYTDLSAAPLALGQLTDGVTLRDLTGAYTALAGGGVYSKCRSYILVTDSKGEIILDNRDNGERVFSQSTASIMTKLLEGVVEYGTAKDIRLKYSMDVAGKTGTSDSNRDKWFIGYTPYYLCGVWCGKKDNSTLDDMPNYHLEVWNDIMKSINMPYLKSGDEPLDFKLSGGVTSAKYCKDSGCLPSRACELDPRHNRIVTGYFKAGEAPTSKCDSHIMVKYNTERKSLACEECNKFNVIDISLVKAHSRNFPVQIYIKDAQYMWIPAIDEDKRRGNYSGISWTYNGKCYNDKCEGHMSEYEDGDIPIEDKDIEDWVDPLEENIYEDE